MHDTRPLIIRLAREAGYHVPMYPKKWEGCDFYLQVNPEKRRLYWSTTKSPEYETVKDINDVVRAFQRPTVRVGCTNFTSDDGNIIRNDYNSQTFTRKTLDVLLLATELTIDDRPEIVLQTDGRIKIGQLTFYKEDLLRIKEELITS